MIRAILGAALFVGLVALNPRLFLWLLIAAVAYGLWRGRNPAKVREAPDDRTRARKPAGPAPRDLADLLFLQRALREGHESGLLKTSRWEALDREIEDLLAAGLEDPGENRMRRLDRAWELLSWYSRRPLGPPPWVEAAAETPPTAAGPSPAPAPETQPLPDISEPAPPGARPEIPAAPPLPRPVAPPPQPRPAPLQEVLRPAEPGPLELALKAAGRQWAVFTPFLVQNIGWFLGGFCFVAGSMFLVAYTTGFAKALSVWISLTLYVFLLLGGGFYLRLRRPDLRAAGLMLLCLSAALIPLALAAAARLWLTADSLGGRFVAALASGVDLAVFGLALPLVAGGIDRRLARGQPRLFLALAGLQLLAPLVAAWPFWAFLAVAQTALIVLLAAGLRSLLRDWLPAAPDERTRLAAYAGGSLLYAAAVSYAHLTLTLPGPLPSGYHGPFLMAVCALGFYGEARVRAEGRDSPWLSRLGFLWYGLSAAALALAFPGKGPRLLSLALGTALYAGVIRHYLTLVPLYALALCLAWLYLELVLVRLPDSVWLWAAAPLWLGLARVNVYALRRRSEALSAIARRLLAGLLLVTTAWSLLHAQPGWIGCTTAWLAAVLTETQRRGVPDGGSREALIGAYAVPLLVLLGLAYAPPIPGLDRTSQWVASLGLFQLAGLEWTLRRSGAWIPRPGSEQVSASRMSPLLDWVLATVPLTLVGAVAASASWIPPAAALLSALTLIRLGWHLLCRWALYSALVLLGATVAWIKLAYLSGTSGGLYPFLAALAVHVLLRREETRPEAALQLAALRAGRLLPLHLWGRVRLELPEDAERESVWAGPLRAAFLALWGLGLVLLAWRGDPVRSPGFWAASALAGMAVSRLVVARFELPFLMLLVHSLGLAAAETLLAGWGTGTGGALLLASVYGLLLVWPSDPLGTRVPWLRKWVPRSPAVAAWNAGLGLCFALAGIAGTLIAAWDRALPGAVPAYLVATSALLVSMRAGRIRLWTPVAGVVAGAVALLYASLAGSGLRALPEDRMLPLLLALLGVGGAWLAGSEILFGGAVRMPGRRFLGDRDGILAQGIRRTAAWWGAAGTVQVLWQVGPIPSGGPDPLHAAALALAAGALWLAGRGLRREILAEAGMLAGMIAVLWLEALATGADFGYWMPVAGDRWLVLGAIVLALAAAGSPGEDREPAHCLRTVGGAWAWAFANVAALAALWLAGAAPGSAWLPWLWTMLAAAWVPLRGLWGPATVPHGLVAGLLLAAGGHSLRVFVPWALVELCFAGAFLLLILAWRTVPLWNARFPRWMLDAGTWPWLGLALAGTGLAMAGSGPVPLWLAAAYLVLWAYACGLAAPLWLGALGVVLGGFAACHEIVGRFISEFTGTAVLALNAAAGLIWLMLLSVAVKRLRSGVAETEAEPFRAIFGRTLGIWTALGLALTAAAYGLAVILRLPGWPKGLEPVWLLPGLLLAVTLAGRYRWNEDRLAAQGSIPALLLVWLNIDLALPTPFHPATALLAPAALVAYLAGRQDSGWPAAANLPFWRAAVPVLVVLALVLLPEGSPCDFGACLAGLGLIAALVGRQTGDRVWLRASGLAFLILLHLWPGWVFGLLAVPGWAALQLGLWAGIADAGLLRRRPPSEDTPWSAMRRESVRLASGLSGLEWAAAAVLAVAASGAPASVTLAAGLVLLLPGTYREYDRTGTNPSRINLALMVGSLLLARLLIRGDAVPDSTDGLALIALGYGALGLYERFRLGSLLALARLLPALAWLPAANRPEVASPILAAAGILYLLAGRGERLWFWLGILALNAAAYLWVPLLSHSTGLVQVYALPAALSALVLVHLHRHELLPAVRHGVRLAAIATLYASAAVDLFQRPELPLFVLALFLSLAGVVLGIAFRIRAFLYGGTVFLVLTVLGQLVLLYPEDRLARAVVLMALGTGITVAMIGFQIKREALLRRIRIVRADLGRWE